MADLDLDALLAPLQDDAPCGADLEYDPAFLALEAAGAGKPEQQYGDTVIPAEEPDWPAVHEQALALARRTRDLRVAVWLARAGARLHGFGAALDGLSLIRGLLERHWAHVHPQLDASDNDDPTMRLNALQPLVSGTAAIADFRAASLTGQRGGPRVRDVELALGNADPIADESVPSPEGLMAGLAAQAANDPALAARLHESLPIAQGIVAAIETQLGAGQGPDFAPLLRLFKPLAAAAGQLQGQGGEAVAAPVDGASAPAGLAVGAVVAGAVAAPGTIASRDDAVRALQRVCEWIERHEPSNPAPLLIRRAQRLMSKSFLEIMRDLNPDGVHEIEKLAGTPSE
ncbi:type VI secretion system protein ImpA [Mitsuaria sp. PDC51]|uniref:type VI secretion system protein TssA n=1 Tax=unclassified Roseateles TaxID=2626991 RepID=UPI0008DEAF4B|nr:MULTISPECIES: type VI secretion system protein TssA [unclassified Roseateles]MBB3293163.1 type VI secretion system protein ImpA [Mitsuaria sp. BK041]MBB3362380.1 type VI secretion system protein ImpA [Mitsuaria sp. BK045]SFR79546.1 type VI secretion system protein ImpA [Mitsuaria sp. PDC51]